MTTTGPAKTQPYHHGDLRNALVAAGVGLAQEGGASAIVLREAARRVGVSPNAAYRHFAALPDLVEAVADVSLATLAGSMQAELDRRSLTGDAQLDAMSNLHAVGRGYVVFALGEPGLFSAAFSCAKPMPRLAEDDTEMTPNELLERSLDGLVDAGLLDPANRPAAAATAWAGVHGLSTLLLGPMSAVPLDERDAFIDSCLSLIAYGLVKRD